MIGYAFVFRILGRIYSLTALVNFLLVHELRAEMAKQPAAFQLPRTHLRVCTYDLPRFLPLTDFRFLSRDLSRAYSFPLYGAYHPGGLGRIGISLPSLTTILR